MSDDNDLTIRRLNARDYDAIARIATESDYVYCRFDQRELERILTSLPAVGAFTAPPGPLPDITGGTLHAFLLINQLASPSAWIGGFGVPNSEARNSQAHLARLLPGARSRCGATRSPASLLFRRRHRQRLARALAQRVWLHARDAAALVRQDRLFYTPSHGAQDVRVRPFTPADLDGLLAVKKN